MPPVRWKSPTMMAVYAIIISGLVQQSPGQRMQEAISMTSDGWRPIIGTRPDPSPYRDEILHYRNPISNGESVRVDTPSTPPPTTSTTTKPPSTKPIINAIQVQGKVKQHQMNPFFALPNHGNHGPHIPLGAVQHTRPGQVGQIKKYPTSSKPFLLSMTGKRQHLKPVRLQATSHSNRDEIFSAAPSTGAYAFFKQGVKTRETGGLGLPGHFINQQHPHVEFNSRFALPPTSESVFQQFNPLQGYIFPKHPQSNDVNYQFQNQNDEYTRNLVPPPLYKNQKEAAKTEGLTAQLPSPLFEFSSQKINKEPVQVQVTKEKLNVFHNNIPPTYNGDYVDYEFHSVRKPPTPLPKLQTYEVTEGKQWQETPQYVPLVPTQQPKIALNLPPFLPTPYKPEGVVPTSPTQSEVSTIFGKLSTKLQSDYNTPNPHSFDVKEVSTHFPILGKPVFHEPLTTPELTNDITTHLQEEVTTTRRPAHRRRRPISHRLRPTTTEEPAAEAESYELQKTVKDSEMMVEESVETERPMRPRRPLRYRTTTPSSSEEIGARATRGRTRHRTRPTTTEASVEEVEQTTRRRIIRPPKIVEVTEIMPVNHKMPTEEEMATTEMLSQEIEENVSETSGDDEESRRTVVYELPGRHYATEPEKNRFETIQPFVEVTSTTERSPTTNLHIPENEVVDTSTEEIEEVTTPTPTTTSTTTTSTTRMHRIRGRPLKYDNSNRPRFSVKDYRQKLSQYSSTTSTTETPAKVRYPSRLRRPLSSTTSATVDEEESTERSKFVPKEPRHHSNDETVIAEKNVKAVNTRLRPFGRQRSSTSTTTTPKVSIRPNLFASRRRPPMLSLRERVIKKKNITTEEKTESVPTTEEDVVTTVKETTEEIPTTRGDVGEDEDVEATTDTLKNESYIYSQRVSDLTSSSKNEYNTPGLFKSVSPTSRRIPNYFTIATDDPILPIEAFFPNIKDKE